jgi:Lipocalin-like domain
MMGGHSFRRSTPTCSAERGRERAGSDPRQSTAANDSRKAFNGVARQQRAYHGDKVSHHIDTSWNQAWTGTTQVRQFTIDGNTLHIRRMPAKNPLTGRLGTADLIWTKVE